MSGDVHVRFRERLGVQFPRATRRCITCSSAAQARAALETASRLLEQLGVSLNPRKTRIVHVRQGFEFLGFKIKRGSRPTVNDNLISPLATI